MVLFIRAIFRQRKQSAHFQPCIKITQRAAIIYACIRITRVWKKVIWKLIISSTRPTLKWFYFILWDIIVLVCMSYYFGAKYSKTSNHRGEHKMILAKKHSIATITKLRSLELMIKTPLLHILYYINGLTHDFWTRIGGWEFDRSHGAGTSSPSHWQQVDEQAAKPVGWTMCFLLMTLVPVQKLCVNIYVYIYVCTFLIRVLF